MLAIIKTGGKQYLVSPGDKLKVEKIDQEVGKEITLTDVLLCDRNNKVEIGSPLVKGMEIKAKIVKHGKGEKLIIFKYKPKKRYKRKIGHRQLFTEIEILQIKD
ncbi:MAG: 50S ribosomal protein L21 [Parcubacteria group bacterium GW2011_GWA2_33_14]|uniref:Large ribosomal subunit protein bL21 n=1 Tax=Candidatus Staskawiczbacteria bacterium RIFCSPHIGHO2_02_FULL_33_16 TaxID=1802204 RepID=A0A1G2HT69_9BACT|nr:MAG: 50S ribosomal protein L21 [Parcubacteria group bacterium GW2011_GWA2_33_14]OGZ65732.1 MAG: 50S ribosomal protein L21 [Candidatus Staskawiczbacteria bacterium RIFCSPHIGHO2_02_FULL_33_16]OGZ70011.1 MAG: 50S ribosomal protein L21 [Candidatus Staskawiczbacteria bacterium RIFCSPLOWO2_01_FULL_33_13]